MSLPVLSILAAIFLDIAAFIFILELSIFHLLVVRRRIEHEIPYWVSSIGYTLPSFLAFVFGIITVSTYVLVPQIVFFGLCSVTFIGAVLLLIRDIHKLDETRRRMEEAAGLHLPKSDR
jgi:hypothetical protein